MFSCFPYLRSLATITWDTLDWYGYDKDGGSVHDVIGTRCDPYTSKLLSENDYHYCCHSNLTRALVKEKGLDINDAEKIVHDVLNVFMLTGFTNDTKQYFMKSSPVRPGDYSRIFCRDRSFRRSFCLPRWRLWFRAFFRYCKMFSTESFYMGC